MGSYREKDTSLRFGIQNNGQDATLVRRPKDQEATQSADLDNWSPVTYLLYLVRRYSMSRDVRDVSWIPPQPLNDNHFLSVAQCDTFALDKIPRSPDRL
jgi:hypothetical protein